MGGTWPIPSGLSSVLSLSKHEREWTTIKWNPYKPRELAEAALAHTVGGVEGAYFRSDLIERRRRLMEDWARYLTGASAEEIAENDFNLNIPRYVDTFEPEEEIDVAALQKEIDQIEVELVEVRGRMKGYLKELGVEV